MNTVRALEHLAFTALSTSELAESLQISVRNARRLIQRLELEGFITQEKRGSWRRYRATLRLAALGRQTLDHSPITHPAAAAVAQLAHDTACAAHLWISGYDQHLVCAAHADTPTGRQPVAFLAHVAAAPKSAAGTVLLTDRAHLRSSCYQHATTEPTFAAAVLHNSRVIAALGITGHTALDASHAVVTAAAQLSQDLAAQR
jgi:DNA-binding IclR family transcriptional regulator